VTGQRGGRRITAAELTEADSLRPSIGPRCVLVTSAARARKTCRVSSGHSRSRSSTNPTRLPKAARTSVNGS